MVRNAMSFHGLGAVDAPDIEIDYYASPSSLRWSSASMKRMHDDLVNLDRDWHRALAALDPSLLVHPDLVRAAELLQSYPAPIIGEIALLLEVLGGNRPFDQNCISMLLFARDRCTGVAAGSAGIATTAGIVAGVMTAFPVDLGISAASLAAIATFFGVSAAVVGGLAGICAAIARGELPKKADYELMIGAAAVATGETPPSSSAVLSALDERLEADDTADKRQSTIELAKTASLRKREACRSRGGVFDPRVPGGCRLPDPKRVTDKLKSAGIDIDVPGGKSLLVPAGLAAVGVIGIALVIRLSRPRKNPRKPTRKPRPTKRRRRRH